MKKKPVTIPEAFRLSSDLGKKIEALRLRSKKSLARTKKLERTIRKSLEREKAQWASLEGRPTKSKNRKGVPKKGTNAPKKGTKGPIPVDILRVGLSGAPKVEASGTIPGWPKLGGPLGFVGEKKATAGSLKDLKATAVVQSKAGDPFVFASSGRKGTSFEIRRRKV